jgi:hypothetical protein
MRCLCARRVGDNGCLTYAHGLRRGCVTVAVGVLIVSEAARLAREGGAARPGSKDCCPAK